MTTYSPKETRRLLDLRDKATPGPWEEKPVRDTNKTPYPTCFQAWNFVEPDVCALWKGAEAEANMAFIVTAHDLADQLEAAQAVIEKQREALERIVADCDHCVIECPHCSHIERMNDLDLADEARKALRLTEDE